MNLNLNLNSYWRPFSALARGESALKVAQVAVSRRFEHHTVFIGCQKQGCPHYCLRQGTGATLALGNAPYRLQRDQFVSSLLSIFTALPRAMDRTNAKLSESINCLF